MIDATQNFIEGAWVKVFNAEVVDVIDPRSEQRAGRVALGTAADVDRAVAAARAAFPDWSDASRVERLAIFDAIIAEYERRLPHMAEAISAEMGAPAWLARDAQAAFGLAVFRSARQTLAGYDFVSEREGFRVAREPVGVCGMITPWNWPALLIATKVAPALAVGCTIVLKPSEMAPFSGRIFAEILAAAGLPNGVFNLVNGDGATVGAAIAAHPDIDMVSFTGSTRAGIDVARRAAETVKRVHQELGGKSANIILPDAELQEAVSSGVTGVMLNSGQSCNAPTRMFVARDRLAEAEAIAAETSATVRYSPGEGLEIGPVANGRQWNKVQSLITSGIEEGARLVAGGPGKPDGANEGFFARATVFSDVTPDMAIARVEIFGPVLAILPYDSIDHAIEMANASPYGLSAYVSGSDPVEVQRVAKQLRAGQVLLNGAPLNLDAPFGGYKQSGNGREWGPYAFAEFCEIKAIVGRA